jgi:hypothetical protein
MHEEIAGAAANVEHGADGPGRKSLQEAHLV